MKAMKHGPIEFLCLRNGEGAMIVTRDAWFRFLDSLLIPIDKPHRTGTLSQHRGTGTHGHIQERTATGITA